MYYYYIEIDMDRELILNSYYFATRSNLLG
jgi:hypothetical protein